MSRKKVFEFALELGEVMLRNGAETYRVEDTMTRILKVTGCSDTEVFVTPTGIFATLNNEDMEALSYTKRVDHRTLHLYKVSLTNDLSRHFCRGDYSVDEAREQLDSIKKEASYSPLMVILATIAASWAFTYMFDGTHMDAMCSAIIGSIVGTMVVLLKRLSFSKFFIDLFGGIFIATLGLLLHKGFGLGLHFESIIAGAIMPFVPGVALTNAIYDTIQGNLLSGISRATEAVIIAASLAAGIGGILSGYESILGGIL